MLKIKKKNKSYKIINGQKRPKLIEIKSGLDRSDNNFFGHLKNILSTIFQSNKILVFIKDELKITNDENPSWNFSFSEKHIFLDNYINSDCYIIENPEMNISLVKDQNLADQVNLNTCKLLVYNLENLITVISIPKNKKLTTFQKKYFENLNQYIEIKNESIPKIQFDDLDQIVNLIIQTISKKDTYTGGHTKRVGMFAEMISNELGLGPRERKEVAIAAMIHDVGKIGIPDHILKKESPLTDDEFDVMKMHPKIGADILKKMEGFQNIAMGVGCHHERPDGTGYPEGLKGDEIPLIAKIVSLSDAFDAMISTRPYRKATTPDEAFTVLKKFRGTQFDGAVFDAFERAFLKSNMAKKYKDIKKVG